MTRISARSKKIVDDGRNIDGIIFQTNIVVLNTAVEVARAGKQGRGFAVFAAEVSSLAQCSASKAKQIAALINESVRALTQGSRIVDKASATLTRIVNGARHCRQPRSDQRAANAAEAGRRRHGVDTPAGTGIGRGV